MSKTDFTFTITGPIEVEESFGERGIFNGTFMKLNHVTQNGREYQLDEGRSIAETIVGMPVGFGTQWWNNKHKRDESNQIGRVIRAIYDETSGVIKGAVEIWNTIKFPDIVQKVAPGWGFSMGGKADNLVPTGLRNSLGRAIMKVVGMKPHHMQIIEPEKQRGQSMAQIEGDGDLEGGYSVEESFSWTPCPWGICEILVNEIEESAEDKVPIEITSANITNDVILNLQNSINDLKTEFYTFRDTPVKLEEPVDKIVEPTVVPHIKNNRKVYITEDPDSTLI